MSGEKGGRACYGLEISANKCSGNFSMAVIGANKEDESIWVPPICIDLRFVIIFSSMDLHERDINFKILFRLHYT